LIKQSSYKNAHNPHVHLSLRSSIEYPLTDWLYFFAHGQHLTKPLNNSFEHDPVTHMNPLFIQTELGTGLRARHKNMEADMGSKTQFDTQFQKSKPINMMNSRVRIGF